MHQTYNTEPTAPSHAFGGKRKMTQKRNAVLYLDAELVSKTRELGFNLSKTFENHLKQLVNQFSNGYSQNNSENNVIGSSREIRTLVGGSKAQVAIMHACLRD
jgi:post-segregation antitoxin (ccd killing protein)